MLRLLYIEAFDLSFDNPSDVCDLLKGKQKCLPLVA